MARLNQNSEISSTDNPENTSSSTITVPEHERKKRARRPFPEALYRVKLCHSLSLEERTCQAHDCEMKEMGFEVSEKLDIIPAVIRVLQHKPQKLMVSIHIHICDFSLKECPQQKPQKNMSSFYLGTSKKVFTKHRFKKHL